MHGGSSIQAAIWRIFAGARTWPSARQRRMSSKKPVFFDASAWRAARLSTLGWAAALISTVLAIGFVTSLLVTKPVATVDFPSRTYAPPPKDLGKKAVA